MKTLVVLMSLVSIPAFAQSQCEQNFQTSIAHCDAVAYTQILSKHGAITECKTVQWNGINSLGNPQTVNMNVVLLAKNGLAVIDNQSTATCKVRYMTLNDSAVEAKVFIGRVIMRSKSGKLYAVTRTGSVKELMNDMGRPYYGVKDIKINQERELVEVTHGARETLTARELFDRVNQASKSELIAL